MAHADETEELIARTEFLWFLRFLCVRNFEILVLRARAEDEEDATGSEWMGMGDGTGYSREFRMFCA